MVYHYLRIKTKIMKNTNFGKIHNEWRTGKSQFGIVDIT